MITLADMSSWISGFALSWLLQTSILILCGVGASRILGRNHAAARSMILRLTLLAVLVSPLVTWGFMHAELPGWSIPLLSTVNRSPAPRRPATEPAVAVPARATEVPPDRVELTPNGMVESSTPALTGSAIPTVETLPSTQPWTWGPVGILAALWLAISLLLLVRLALQVYRTHRLLSESDDGSEASISTCHYVARCLGMRPPSVRTTPFLSSPCLVGIARPTILLTESDSANPKLEVFVHEMAHLRRRDAFWQLLANLAVSVLWCQPLTIILTRRLAAAAEDVCDDYVLDFVGDRTSYARQLVEIAESSVAPMPLCAVGMVTFRSSLRRRVLRILDPARVLSTRVGLRYAVTLLTLMFGLSTAVGLISVVESRVVMASAKFKNAVGDTTITGQVLDAAGAPLADARVLVARSVMHGPSWTTSSQILGQGSTDKHGRYELAFDMPKLIPREMQSERIVVVAQAPQHGPAWQEYKNTSDLPASVDLQLVADRLVEGRIIDLEGQPVPNAKMRVRRIESAAGDLDAWAKKAAKNPLAEPRDSSRLAARPTGNEVVVTYFPSKSQLDAVGLDLFDEVVTDREGRFRLAGVGADRLLSLKINDPRLATSWVNVVTRPMKSVPMPIDPRIGNQRYYGAQFDFPAEPSRLVRGVIRDADSKQPLPGVKVTAAQLSGSMLAIDGLIATRTDASGRFELAGLPARNGHRLRIHPVDLPYFHNDYRVPDTDGLEPVEMAIEMKRGIWIEGQVVDQETGDGVPSWVSYYPFLDNVEAESFENFDPGVISMGYTDRYDTDEAGRFRVPGLPGRGIVVAAAGQKAHYHIGFGADDIEGLRPQGRQRRMNVFHFFDASMANTVVEVNSEGDAIRDCRVPLSPVDRHSIAVVDENGNPLTGFRVTGLLPEVMNVRNPRLRDAPTVDASKIEVLGLQQNGRTLLLDHRDLKLGRVMPLDASADLATIVLQPTFSVRGQLLNDEGTPMANTSVTPIAGKTTKFMGLNTQGAMIKSRGGRITMDRVVTDADGRFEFDSLLPGTIYTLLVHQIEYEIDEQEPGSHVDLGVLKQKEHEFVPVEPTP